MSNQVHRPNASRPVLTAVDLFAGAGGASEGLRRAGFVVVAAVENEERAALSYAANHKATKLLVKDIREVAGASLVLSPTIDLLQACPPCQTFSTLGKASEEDDRTELVHEVTRLIAEVRPRSFVLENVPGLSNNERLSKLIRSARGMGYGVRRYYVNAADFGVPQNRRRLIVIGVLGVRASALPEDLRRATPRRFKRRATLRSVFNRTARLPTESDELHRARRLRSTTAARLTAIPAGGNRFDLPEDLQLDCHKKLKGRSAAASYGRMSIYSLAPTLTTRCTTVSCGSFGHPTELRGISLREAALIQTFPLSYRFVGTYESIERQIGNAVPIRLAQAIAEVLKDYLA